MHIVFVYVANYSPKREVSWIIAVSIHKIQMLYNICIILIDLEIIVSTSTTVMAASMCPLD